MSQRIIDLTNNSIDTLIYGVDEIIKDDEILDDAVKNNISVTTTIIEKTCFNHEVSFSRLIPPNTECLILNGSNNTLKNCTNKKIKKIYFISVETDYSVANILYIFKDSIELISIDSHTLNISNEFNNYILSHLKYNKIPNLKRLIITIDDKHKKEIKMRNPDCEIFPHPDEEDKS
jgi:protein-disulfide isomerase